MTDKTDSAALHGFQSGLLEAMTQEEAVAEGAGLSGQQPQTESPRPQQGGLQQQAAEPLALMGGADIEQAEVTVIAQGDKAERDALRLGRLLYDPAVVLAQLAGEAGVMGAEGPLLDLGLAVMFWTCLANRLLEQRDQLGDVLLPQRHDLQGGRLL